MDGLEAVEINYSRISNIKNKRIDNEYFLKAYIKNENQLKKFGYKKIGNIISKITDFGAYSQTNFIELCDYGVNFLRNQDIKDNSIDLLGCAKISNDVYQRLSLQLEENDILIPRAGTLGNAGVISKECLPASANQNLAVLRESKEILPYFISTVLCSDIGKLQIERMATGNVQQWLNLDAIKEIKIPDVTKEFQSVIQQIILLNNKLLKEARQLYLQAEKDLLNIINAVGYSPLAKSISVKLISDSFLQNGRLDAEYYQNKYDLYEELIRKCGNGYSFIRHEFQVIQDKCDRSLDQYFYIEIGDVNVSDGTVSANVVATKNLPENAKIMTQKGDVIVSTVRPNRGAVAILEDSGNLVSGAFTVLRETGDYPKEVLQVLLRTPVYRDWLLKYNVGTSYPVIKDDDILNMPIPLIDLVTKQKIVNNVQESFTLRGDAKKLLECAKTAVEVAIEFGEEKAIEWLNEEGVEI